MELGAIFQAWNSTVLTFLKLKKNWKFPKIKLEVSKLEKFHFTVFFLKFSTYIPLLLLNIYMH